MYLIGVDCATNPKDVGIALSELIDTLEILEVHAGTSGPWKKVAEWLSELPGQSVLIALDAPLGWPIPLREALEGHSAGNPVENCPNAMFRRETDRHIRQYVGKQPLDVGADRIARTAHAALKGLNGLRASIDSPIRLAWNASDLTGISVIEVYPAATLKAYGMHYEGFKKKSDPSHRRVREEIIRGIPEIELSGDARSVALDNSDGLDAVVCILAATDFVRGEAMKPVRPEVAHREGWIWCRDPRC